MNLNKTMSKIMSFVGIAAAMPNPLAGKQVIGILAETPNEPDPIT